MRRIAERRQVQMSAGNRDEWRYYSEELVVRSVGHVARMDFMRIDFYDDIVLRWPNGARDQVDATHRGTGGSSGGISPQGGICRQLRVNVTHRRALRRHRHAP